MAQRGALGTSGGPCLGLRHAYGVGQTTDTPPLIPTCKGQGAGGRYLAHPLGHGVSVGRSQRDVEDDDGVHHDHHRHHHEEGQVPVKGVQGLSCHAAAGLQAMVVGIGVETGGNAVALCHCTWRVGTSCL